MVDPKPTNGETGGIPKPESSCRDTRGQGCKVILADLMENIEA